MAEPSRTRLAILAILALSSLSCSDNTVVDTVATHVDIRADIPPDQRDAYEDGTVDTGEYYGAFNLFRSCANADEPVVVNIQTDPTSRYISYGVKGDLSAPGPSNGTLVDDCYQRYFSWIEATWQTTDPGALDSVMQQNLDFFENVMRPCLEANDAAIPDEVIPGTDAFGDLSKQFESLNAAGKCTTSTTDSDD